MSKASVEEPAESSNNAYHFDGYFERCVRIQSVKDKIEEFLIVHVVNEVNDVE